MVNAEYLAFTTFLAYRTVSIKRPGLTFFQKSLLNVPYDRKNEGLDILSYRSYNRMVRVCLIQNYMFFHQNSYFFKFAKADQCDMAK